MIKLPGFSSDGLLPPGDYEMTLSQLRASMLVSGPGPSAPHWDRVWRAMLVDNLGVLANQLWQVGIGSIYTADHPRNNCRCGISTAWSSIPTTAAG